MAGKGKLRHSGTCKDRIIYVTTSETIRITEPDANGLQSRKKPTNASFQVIAVNQRPTALGCDSAEDESHSTDIETPSVSEDTFSRDLDDIDGTYVPSRKPSGVHHTEIIPIAFEACYSGANQVNKNDRDNNKICCCKNENKEIESKGKNERNVSGLDESVQNVNLQNVSLQNVNVQNVNMQNVNVQNVNVQNENVQNETKRNEGTESGSKQNGSRENGSKQICSNESGSEQNGDKECESKQNESGSNSNQNEIENLGTNLNVEISDSKLSLVTQSLSSQDKFIGRFQVVKVESFGPFRRGRWICHDYLDNSTHAPKVGYVYFNGMYVDAAELKSKKFVDQNQTKHAGRFGCVKKVDGNIYHCDKISEMSHFSKSENKIALVNMENAVALGPLGNNNPQGSSSGNNIKSAVPQTASYNVQPIVKIRQSAVCNH